MTNEHYLVVSYFAAAGAGVLAGAVTAAVLRKPLVRAMGGLAGPLGRLLQRALPTWLIVAALCAFTSVSYFDCGHHTYRQVVEDGPHMVAVTHTQAQYVLIGLGIVVFTYALGLAVAMAVFAAAEGHESPQAPAKPADR